MNKNEDTSVDTTQYNRRLMGNITRLPLTVVTASGSEISTEESGPLLDFWGDEGVQSLGYGEVVNMMLTDFIATGAPHQLPDVYPHRLRWDAAEIICSMTGMDRIFFCNSGTEANEAMIKIARKYWWDFEGQPMINEDRAAVATRHRILTVEGNFHGRTGHSLAASDPRVSPYHRWGFGPTAKGFGVIAYDAICDEFFEVVADGVEHPVPQRVDWQSVAAITMAPVLGNNCVITFKPEFWRALGRVRTDTGTLIMFDDVQAGSGRAGYPATWQHPDVGVKPDIMALGKGMALGFPAAAMLASEEITKSFTPGVHFNTFGGSPFVCYLMWRYYRWLDQNLHHVRELGEGIREQFGIRDWIKHHDGAGLLNAFTPDFERHGYDGFKFIHKAREFGLSLVTHRQFGPIRFTPPMTVTYDAVKRAFDALDQTHNALEVG